MPRWAVADLIAKSLHARGLVDSPVAQIWASDQMAAEHLGFPVQHVRAMGTAEYIFHFSIQCQLADDQYRGALVSVNPFRLGWQPKWDEKKLLESIDDEVQAVLELDTVETTVFNTLMPSKD